MSPHDDNDLNEVLTKAINETGDYVMGTVQGKVVRFSRIQMDGRSDDWLMVKILEGGDSDNLAPWINRALHRNGAVVRVDQIAWCADLG